MQRIPRGVADDDRWAVVGTRAGELVALDPRTGVVHWRQGRGLRPCAVTGQAVVAVRGQGPDGPEVVVLGRSDGRELWTAPLPVEAEWARRAVADDPTSSIDAAVEDDEQVLLRWRASTRYEGGAAPGPGVLAEHTRDAEGALRIDLRARSVQPAAPGELASSLQGPPATDEPAVPGPGPDVVAAGRAGRLRVELATPATGAVVLRGVDQSDAVIWEVALEEQLRRPPPLRP